MLSRREYLSLSAASLVALSLKTRLLRAQLTGDVITHKIPKTGEALPIIGLGSSATFSRMASSGDLAGIKAVMEALLTNGGTVFDTAPSYRASEDVAGQAVRELGMLDKIFWATKLNVVRGFGGGGSADPDAARAQVEQSLDYLGRDTIDLIQVHNVADVPTQLGILKDYKEQSKIRYIGITSTSKRQYQELATHMRNEPLDFIGVDYAVDNQSAADELFPIALDRGIAVMVYLPFGRTRLWNRVEGLEPPDWAQAFGAATWGQFFLKFAASHPAVTVVTPATSNPEHMIDDLGAARGRLPNEEERQRMVEYVDALPE